MAPNPTAPDPTAPDPTAPDPTKLDRILLPPGPGRLIALITGVMSLGQGLWMALNAIYAISVLHLPPGRFGLCLSISAVIVLLGSTPLGHLADRAGPRGVQFWSFLVMALLTMAMLLVHGFWPYLLVVSAQGLAYRAGRSARKAMIAGLIPSQDRVRTLAYTRSASNLGVTFGAALAGLVLAVGSRTGYQAAMVVAGCAFLATSLLTLKEHEVPPVPASAGPALAVLRDWSFLTFTVLDGLLTTQGLLLDVVLPLWVVQHTSAPRWMSAALLIVNTAFVVVAQTKSAAGTDTPARAARASFQGAGAVAAACLVFALTGSTSVVPACALLLLGALTHAFGEVRQAAGSWTLAFNLAPDHAQGQYQGTHAMGADLGRMFAPALFTWLVIGHGTGGWLALAAGFTLLGATMPLLVSRNPRLRATPTSPSVGASATA
ncbi:MFS transporter [Kitasatospora sp. LaBMicrA B282]|uniref:MFS transporter n=1 Tax=Kitasatospora sp. LaBMicrA B282 TaxID=3420949 RepID=UPI003D147C1E